MLPMEDPMPMNFTPKTSRPLHRLATVLSRLDSGSAREVMAEAMEGHRRAQRLGYECAVAIAAELREGMTERQAADLLQTYLSDRGATTYLHRPFAWFGEHSRFDGYAGYHDFHPSDRALRPGEAAILDVSPILGGYIGDIGYATALGPHPELNRAMDVLRRLRADIPRLFEAALSPRHIWAEVDRRIRDAGYDNIHARYPFCVLGHRVYRVKDDRSRTPIVPLSFIGWFSWQAHASFLRHGMFNELLTPDHDGKKLGLWAIEPHLGGAGFGAKFEEILVVERGRAYWLDDQVPHYPDHPIADGRAVNHEIHRTRE